LRERTGKGLIEFLIDPIQAREYLRIHTGDYSASA
jgi:hypothetical protein